MASKRKTFKDIFAIGASYTPGSGTYGYWTYISKYGSGNTSIENRLNELANESQMARALRINCSVSVISTGVPIVGFMGLLSTSGSVSTGYSPPDVYKTVNWCLDYICTEPYAHDVLAKNVCSQRGDYSDAAFETKLKFSYTVPRDLEKLLCSDEQLDEPEFKTFIFLGVYSTVQSYNGSQAIRVTGFQEIEYELLERTIGIGEYS